MSSKAESNSTIEVSSSKLMIDGYEIEPCGEIKLGKEAVIHLDKGNVSKLLYDEVVNHFTCTSCDHVVKNA